VNLPRFTELFGYNVNEAKGRNLDNGMIRAPEKIEEGKRMTKEALKGKFYYETIRKKKDEILFPVSISGSRVMLDGKLRGTIWMYRDITERKQDEQLHQVLYNISKATNSDISLNQLYKTIHLPRTINHNSLVAQVIKTGKSIFVNREMIISQKLTI